MSSKSRSSRYYPSFRKQWRSLLQIAMMFVATVLFASTLQSQSIGVILLIMSLIFPGIVLWSLLQSIRKINYIVLKADGIHITTLGFFHKFIDRANIKHLDVTHMAGSTVLGIEYKSSYRLRPGLGRLRKRLIGWDEILPDAYSAEGNTSLAEDIHDWFLRAREARGRTS